MLIGWKIDDFGNYYKGRECIQALNYDDVEVQEGRLIDERLNIQGIHFDN